MVRLMIRLLGPFLATLDGTPVLGFESEKVRALLAYLAFESGEVHYREQLAGLLWAEMPDARARSNLSQALYNLRRLLDASETNQPFLLGSHNMIRINPSSDFEVDAISFSNLLAQADLHRHAPENLCKDCVEKLQQAVMLYRGDFLEGLSCGSGLAIEEWCRARRARFNRNALEALHRLATYHESQDAISEALEYAWMQVELDPLDEAAHRQLMRLLAASDQRSLALAQFRQLERILAEELSVTPERATIELFEQIREPTQGKSSACRARHNLPAPLTAFIGRRSELERLKKAVQDPGSRLLTILGPGGSGKTRLALELARSCTGEYPDGVFMVGMNPLSSSEAILPALIEAVGAPLQHKGEPQQQLTNFLRDKTMLLVLDGFEHLLDGAGLLVEILQAAPSVKLLVTSRTRLNIKVEQAFSLEGLHYPQPAAAEEDILASEAVQLFLDGSRRIQPELEPSLANLQCMLQICRQVQGMPLGILLASSWLASVELEQIAVEIERSLDFLSAEWADVPARQRSLRATFDHSWNLLSQDERAILKNLSVFQGGFSRHAARIVAGASPHKVRALVDKSLLLRSSGGRFGMHELLRQYSAQKQAENADDYHAVHERHSQYYSSALQRWAPRLRSPQQENALEEMDVDLENIRISWNWAAQSGAIPLLYSMVDALCLYFSLRVRYHEGEGACRLALEKLDSIVPREEEPSIRLRIMIWQSHFTRLLGRNDQAQRLRDECQGLLERAHHFPESADFERALLSFETGEAIKEREYAAAREYYHTSLRAFQVLAENWWAGQAMLNLAICSIQVGDFDAAQAWLEQCLVRLPQHGDRRSLAKALRWKGFLHVRRGELEAAVSGMQEAAAIYRSVGDRINNADSMSGLGIILLWAGRYAEAIDLSNQSLQIYQELGDRYQTAFMLGIKGLTLAFRGDYSQAVESFEAAIAQGRAYGFRRLVATSRLGLSWIALIEGEIAKASEAVQESIAEYRQVNQLDELGWALAFWGHVQFIQGASQSAQASIREALQIGVDIKAAMTIYQALGACAVWVGRQGDPQRALALYSLVRCNPTLAKSRWFEEIYGRQVAELADGLPVEAAAAAQERGRALDLWETARALIQELS